MPKPRGRKPGLIIFSEAFEAIVAARGLLKKDVAADAGLSPSFLADLLACRGGASPDVAERLASTLGCKVAAIFPERAGLPWVPPIPNRDARREAVA